MEERENMENMEERESRDVIGRKKGPVLASVILAVVLIIFTRGKGLNFGRSEGKQSPENSPAQTQEKTEEGKGASLEEILSDPGAYEESVPETVEVLVDGDRILISGLPCRDAEELKAFLTAFGNGRKYELLTGGADPDTLQRVRDIFESLSVPCTEKSE